MNLEQLKQLITTDYAKQASRDLCIFATSIFGEVYTETIKDLFDIDFPTIVWIVRKGNLMTFYRSEADHQNLRKKYGEKLLQDKYWSTAIKEVTEHTHWMNEFISKNSTLQLFNEHKEEFVNTYREFFAYKKIVYWGADYLLQHNLGEEDMIKQLQDVYAFSENVIPDVEKYLLSLNVHQFRYDQTEGEFKETGFIFRQNKPTIVLYGQDLDGFESYIVELQKNQSESSTIKGVAVSKGKVEGPVQIISDPNKLSEAKEGHIIVTGMTRPQFNHILSKSLGIITEEGNILSHAAILSRESGIPVVAGAKNSMNMLSDGDIVELDADAGLIRRIE